MSGFPAAGKVNVTPHLTLTGEGDFRVQTGRQRIRRIAQLYVQGGESSREPELTFHGLPRLKAGRSKSNRTRIHRPVFQG